MRSAFDATVSPCSYTSVSRSEMRLPNATTCVDVPVVTFDSRLAHRDVVEPERVGDLRRDRLVALAQERRRRRAEEREVVAARAIESLPGEEPRQLLAVGHRRIATRAARAAGFTVPVSSTPASTARFLRSATTSSAGLSTGPSKMQPAAIDVEALAEDVDTCPATARIVPLAVSVAAGRGHDVHAPREARVEPFAGEAEVAAERHLRSSAQRQSRIPSRCLARLADDDDVVGQRAHARTARIRRGPRRW